MSQSKHQVGALLIEVLIASVICGLGIGGYMWLQLHAQQTAQQMRRMEEVIWWQEDLLTRLRINPVAWRSALPLQWNQDDNFCAQQAPSLCQDHWQWGAAPLQCDANTLTQSDLWLLLCNPSEERNRYQQLGLEQLNVSCESSDTTVPNCDYWRINVQWHIDDRDPKTLLSSLRLFSGREQ